MLEHLQQPLFLLQHLLLLHPLSEILGLLRLLLLLNLSLELLTLAQMLVIGDSLGLIKAFLLGPVIHDLLSTGK